VELSQEQKKFFDAIVSNVETVRVQTLGGYAGTGKTTLIGALAKRLPLFAVCAYTGKAAHILRQKGCQATTIHRLIYHPIDRTIAILAAESRLEKLQNRKAPEDEINRALEDLKEAMKPRWELKKKLTDDLDAEVCGVIVDEASMVPEKIYNDLLSFDLPLIFVGDHGQLPPVSDPGAEPFNLMADPMYRLETLHRNAGPISRFAEHIRKGQRATAFRSSSNIVQFVRKNLATTGLLASADQVICPYNRSRVEANRKIRTVQGKHDLLTVGDRVIALRNAQEDDLFNGMQGTVTRVDLDACIMDFVDNSGDNHVDVEFDREQFGQEKYSHRRGGPHPFDYGYVVTCHKAQGSEWPHVIVMDQGWKDQYDRWAYTAASRAKERLTWIC